MVMANSTYLAVVICLLLVSVNVCGAINYRPRFTRPSLVKTIPESVGAGYFIADISVYTVDDEDDIITYGLDSYGKQLCDIGPTTGRLILKKPLDREMRAQFKIVVSAQDSHQGGGQHRTAYLPVYLYVLDSNDNKPVFLNTPYIATVSENATVGSTIVKVAASDADDGQNADISYSLNLGKETLDQFKIDSDTGVITLAKALDYETEKKHTLVVIAKDKGTPHTLESQTTVVINVVDVRDTSPRFLKSSYQAQISENLPLGAPVVKVTAVDGDTEVNHPVCYSLENGNEDGLFFIEKDTGLMKVNGTIDHEKTSIFKIKVKAYEEKDITATAFVHVIILVNDVNDNKPAFQKSHYTFAVEENAPIGFVLADHFSAKDADIDKQNKKFEYSLQGASSLFSIHPFTGRLQVARKLDYETTTAYSFTAVAKETETAEQYEGATNVTVNVINVNDNQPTFERLVYVFTVAESISTDKVVGRVKANDKDIGSYGEVAYEIKSNEVGSPLFSINSKTGEIFAARKLDYTKAQTHHFVVIAQDQGGQTALQSRAYIQIVVIETVLSTTRKISTVATILTTESLRTTDSNEVSPETRRIINRELIDERTRSSSSSMSCLTCIQVLLVSLILSLRALIT